MPLLFLSVQLYNLRQRWQLITYAATWTILLTFTVAIASFTPEFVFVSAVSKTSYHITNGNSNGSAVIKPKNVCGDNGGVRVPLDLPGEIVCIPAQLLRRSNYDVVVPPVFAAIVVVASAWVVRAFCLSDDDHSFR